MNKDIEVDDTDVTVVSNNKVVRVTIENIGEGLAGDYDPKDPEDMALLRFTVFRRDGRAGEWMEVPDASYCTNLPVASMTQKMRRAAGRMILAQMEDMVYGERSIKRLCEKLSWLGLKDVQEWMEKEKQQKHHEGKGEKA